MKILKKIGKWLGYTVLAILAGILLVCAYAYWDTEERVNKVYPTATPAIPIPTDSASIARGAHLYIIHACKDCHGPDLRGRTVMEIPLMGRLVARNLTKGKGGLPADFNDKDWLRTLKHGVNREGKPLLAMPADETTKISDRDLAEIIAFCKSRPPVDNHPGKHQFGLGLRLMTSLTDGKVFPAEVIDHNLKPQAEKQPEVSASYGQYLTANCQVCHQPDFKGSPPLLPGYPPVPNITSTGRVGKWTEAQFMNTLRTGITPDGHQMDSLKMPWSRTREFSETELKAVRVFLLSLPAKQDLAAQ